MKIILEEEYLAAQEDDAGWCTICEEFTADGVEPDAMGYRCPVCGNFDSVMGAEQALISGEISFKEEEVDEDAPIPYKVKS
jgi:Zn finger protein HypA/HybF involved in hydrogenase expression